MMDLLNLSELRYIAEGRSRRTVRKMVHAALLLLTLEAVSTDLVSPSA
jgi:hypothetical protein